MAIQNLLGLSVDNTSEVHTTINVTIAIRDAFETLARIMESAFIDGVNLNDRVLDQNIDNRFEKIGQLIQ